MRHATPIFKDIRRRDHLHLLKTHSTVSAIRVYSSHNCPTGHQLRRPMLCLKVHTRLVEWNLTWDTLSLSIKIPGGTKNPAYWKRGHDICPLGPPPGQSSSGRIQRISKPKRPPRLHIVTRRRHFRSDLQGSLQGPKPYHTNSSFPSFRSHNTYWTNLVDLA